MIEDAINEFDQEHKHGTDESRDDEALTDEADVLDADDMGVHSPDWQDGVEEAGYEQVKTDSE